MSSDDAERLRAREAALVAEHEQAMAIVLEIASGETIYYASFEGTFCVLCNAYVPGNVNVPEYDITQFPHTARCSVTKARALLASAEAGDQEGR